MTEDEDVLGIPHFVADNTSWWYPVDPKKINCAMSQRGNKSLASAILDLREQMQKISLMSRDFCQNHALINNVQSEVETRKATVLCSIPRCSTCIWQPLAALKLTLTSRLPPICPHTPQPNTAVPLNPVEPTHPSTPPPPYTARPSQPSTHPLPPPSAAPSFAVW